MPAAKVTKQFGIGGSHIIGGFHGGPRGDANAYEALQAGHSDMINVHLVLSGLIAGALGVLGGASGIVLTDRLLRVES